MIQLLLLLFLASAGMVQAATTYFQTGFEDTTMIPPWSWCAASGGMNVPPITVTAASGAPIRTGSRVGKYEITPAMKLSGQQNEQIPTASNQCARSDFNNGPGRGNAGGMLEGYFSAYYWFDTNYANNANAWHNIFQWHCKTAGGGGCSQTLIAMAIKRNNVFQLEIRASNYFWSNHPLTGGSPSFTGGYTNLAKGYWGRTNPVAIPRNQWVHFESFYRASRNNGHLIVWQDGVEIFNLSNANVTGVSVFNTLDTQMPNYGTNESRYCGDTNPIDQHPCYKDTVWIVNNYSDASVTNPGTETMYVDDAIVSDTKQSSSADVTAPANPTSFSATTVDHDTISLGTWTAPGDSDLEGYVLDYCTGATDCSSWGNPVTLGLVTSYTVDNLQPDTIHRFRLRAFDEVGCSTNCSTPGATATATTDPPPSGVIVDSFTSGYECGGTESTSCINDEVINADSAATTWGSASSTGVNANPHWIHFTFASPQTIGQVTIYWGRDAPWSNTYHTSEQIIIQNWNGTGWDDVQTANCPGCAQASSLITFTPDSFDQLRIYQPPNSGHDLLPGVMWVTEVDFAAGADSIPPGAPTSVTITGSTQSTITFTWVAPTTNAADLAGYRVSFCDGAACSDWVNDTPDLGLVLTHTLDSLTSNTLYRIRIEAKDGIPNYSTPSSIVEATTSSTSAILAKTHHRFYTPGIAGALPVSREDLSVNVKNAAKVRIRLQIENTGGETQVQLPLSCDYDGDTPFTVSETCAVTGMCLVSNGGVTNGQLSTRYLTLPGGRTFDQSRFITDALALPSVSIGQDKVSEVEYDLKFLSGIPDSGTDVCCRPVGVTGDICFTVTDGVITQ